jgi:hypothetical protein
VSFASVLYLLGTVAVVGPILAHLLAKPRFKAVPFTMLSFLDVSTKDIQARRRLRNFLLLLLRCLIICVIAAMFAGPLLAGKPASAHPERFCYIALDDSMSMSYDDGSGARFDEMIGEAEKIVEGCDEGTLFDLFSMASGRRARNLTRPAALAALRGCEASPRRARVADFAAELRAAVSQAGGGSDFTAAVLSDFTPSMIHELSELGEPVEVDSAVHVKIGDSAGRNTAILGAELISAKPESLQVAVRVRNYGAEPVKNTLVVDGALAARERVELGAGEEKLVHVDIPLEDGLSESEMKLEFSLAEGDGLAADDSFRLAVAVTDDNSRNVLVVGEKERDAFLIKTAVETIDRHEPFTSIDCRVRLSARLSAAEISSADIVIFAGVPGRLAEMEDALASFITKGGRAVFFVSEGSSRSALESLGESVLGAKVGDFVDSPARIKPLPVEPDSLRAVDTDGTDAAALLAYRLDNIILTGRFQCEPGPEADVLWNFDGDMPFMVFRRMGEGFSLFVNTSADGSLGGLMKSPAAVAFVRLLVERAAVPEGRWFSSEEVIGLPTTDAERRDVSSGKAVWILSPSGEPMEGTISGGLLSTAKIDEVGWYATVGKPQRFAAVNLPEGETDLSAVEEEAVSRAVACAILQGVETVVTIDGESPREYTPLWKYFAWCAVALIVVEALVANRVRR